MRTNFYQNIPNTKLHKMLCCIVLRDQYLQLFFLFNGKLSAIFLIINIKCFLQRNKTKTL